MLGLLRLRIFEASHQSSNHFWLWVIRGGLVEGADVLGHGQDQAAGGCQLNFLGENGVQAVSERRRHGDEGLQSKIVV